MMMVGKYWEPAEELIRRPSPAGFQNISVTDRHKKYNIEQNYHHPFSFPLRQPCAAD